MTNYYQTVVFQVQKKLGLCSFIMNSSLDEVSFILSISSNEYCSFELETALSRSSVLPGAWPDSTWLAHEVTRVPCTTSSTNR